MNIAVMLASLFKSLKATKLYLMDTDYGSHSQVLIATVNLDSSLSGYQSKTDATFDAPQGIVII